MARVLVAGVAGRRSRTGADDEEVLVRDRVVRSPRYGRDPDDVALASGTICSSIRISPAPSTTFGAIGALAGHMVMGLPMTMFSMFGIVALSGLVVNDSIFPVDFIHACLRQGRPLVEAGTRRFRPVFLTSITTIAGLGPLLLETSFQARLLVPMAMSLIFGLAFSTFLVLFLVSTAYWFYARIAGVPQPYEEDESEEPRGPRARRLMA